MIPPEIVQAIVIAVGNFLGILVAYYLLDRRTERKIGKYWQKIRKSPEGEDMFALIKEGRNFLQSKEVKDLMKDLSAGLDELRALLKQIREKAEASAKEEDTGGPLLPSLEEGK